MVRGHKKPKENHRERSKHLHYEFSMFNRSKKELMRYLNNPGCFSKNLLLESTLLHARILFDVFYPRKINRGDVFARQFLAKPAVWTTIMPSSNEKFIGDFCKRVNKLLAHLTKDRAKVSYEDKDWLSDIEEAEKYIREAMCVLLNNAPEDRLGKKLLELKKTMRVM